ncbi:MAG: outer membrane beta-barrel protein [Phaeodactylibacter sp.]|nr:outer membrane beta-barrel protein [Phaeodactylibacter sp.]
MRTRFNSFHWLLLLVLSLGFSGTVQAQARRTVLPQRFSAAVFFGLNAGQMDGDKHNGYNKLGPFGGLRGGILLNRQSQVGLDLYYSRRGSRSDRNSNGSPLNMGQSLPVNITLDYAQVGLNYNYLFAENYDDFFSWSFNIGLTYGRLLNSDVEEVMLLGGSNFEISQLEDQFRRNALDLGFGFTYNFDEQFGASLRHSVELFPIYRNTGQSEELINRLLQYYLSLNLIYTFY